MELKKVLSLSSWDDNAGVVNLILCGDQGYYVFRHCRYGKELCTVRVDRIEGLADQPSIRKLLSAAGVLTINELRRKVCRHCPAYNGGAGDNPCQACRDFSQLLSLLIEGEQEAARAVEAPTPAAAPTKNTATSEKLRGARFDGAHIKRDGSRRVWTYELAHATGEYWRARLDGALMVRMQQDGQEKAVNMETFEGHCKLASGELVKVSGGRGFRS